MLMPLLTSSLPTPIFAAAGDPLSHVLPHYFMRIGDSGFLSNHLIMGTLGAILTFAAFAWLSTKLDPASKKDSSDFVTRGIFAQLLETLCEFIYDFIAKPQLRHLADKYIGFLWSIFFFILTCNLLGMIPFGYMLEGIARLVNAPDPKAFSHFGGTATANLSLNIPLALCSFIAVLYIGIKETGFKHFVGHFNPLGWDDKKMLPIGIMLFVLEWMGLVIKCVVLAVRLFGTMFAGHLVLAALVGLIFTAGAALGTAAYGVAFGVVLLNVALTMLELFIAFLQAFIFTFLTALFIAMTAVTESDHGHDHEYGRASVPDDSPSPMETVLNPNAT